MRKQLVFSLLVGMVALLSLQSCEEDAPEPDVQCKDCACEMVLTRTEEWINQDITGQMNRDTTATVNSTKTYCSGVQNNDMVPVDENLEYWESNPMSFEEGTYSTSEYDEDDDETYLYEVNYTETREYTCSCN